VAIAVTRRALLALCAGPRSCSDQLVSETHETIRAIYRIESAKLIAHLARMLRDVGRAEELAQDVLVIALEPWPEPGMPDNPGRHEEARAEFERAASLTRNARQRQLLLERAAEEARS
jgi:predicted RNA polymerase sigma factor